ncbi:MAG: hypothetical protein KJ923_03690 [Candidatus Omnitrophica bacterium]|nr:hypothetical protein [Candidatus Omnitrophota bacterium]
MRSIFAKSIFISALGHLTVFSMFTVSLGNKIPQADHPSVAFWGQLLNKVRVGETKDGRVPLLSPRILSSQYLGKIKGVTKPDSDIIISRGVKPLLVNAFNIKKKLYRGEMLPLPKLAERRDPEIFLHPLLPYGFRLYFRDRQVAHVELSFNIVSEGRRTPVLIKRKISSGNLEVDLLAMRYISHYLFIQQASLPSNEWKTVKIDLSAKEQ